MKRIVLFALMVSLLFTSFGCGTPKAEPAEPAETVEKVEPDTGFAGNYCVIRSYNDLDYKDFEPITISSDMTKLSTSQAEYALTWDSDTNGTVGSEEGTVELYTDSDGYKCISVYFTNGDSLHLYQGERIEITADNWEEYFYISPIKRLTVNSFGEVDDVSIVLGIILKDEYASKASYGSADALAFEINYSFTYNEIRFDTKGNVMIGRKLDQKQRKTTVCDLNYISYDTRQTRIELLEGGALVNKTILGSTNGSSLFTLDGNGYSVPGDYKVKRVTGSIILFS